jgi:prophage regulatory protein
MQAVKLLRKPVVLDRLGISNSAFYDGIKTGKFPRPVKIDPDGRAVGWLEAEIDEVIQRAVDRRPATVDAA